MAFVVTENCIRCKYTDCVSVCPVDCFHEGATMLVIHPDECIDCGACVPECPAEAIFPHGHPDADPKWLAINSKYARVWPGISVRTSPMKNADDHNGAPDKFERFFSPSPGERGNRGDHNALRKTGPD